MIPIIRIIESSIRRVFVKRDKSFILKNNDYQSVILIVVRFTLIDLGDQIFPFIEQKTVFHV